jgi:hypothetical protein
MPCYHNDWDQPDENIGTWPSSVTGSIVARTCYGCRTKGAFQSCSNDGEHLLRLNTPIVSFGLLCYNHEVKELSV